MSPCPLRLTVWRRRRQDNVVSEPLRLSRRTQILVVLAAAAAQYVLPCCAWPYRLIAELRRAVIVM